MVRETSSIAQQLSSDCILEELALIEQKPKDSVNVFKAFCFASQSEKLFIGLACFLFLLLGSGTILQTYFGTRANVGLAFEDKDIVLSSIRGQLCVVAVIFVIGAIASFLIEWTAEKQIRRMRMSFYSSLLGKDQAWYDTHDINKLNAEIEIAVVQLRDGIGLKLGEMLKNIAVFLIGTVFAFFFHWQLTLVLSVTIPLLGFTLSLVVRRVNKFATQAKAEYATAGAIAEEALSNIRTVQAFGLEGTFLQKFIDQLDATLGKELSTSLLKGTGVGSIRLLLYACNALGWWYGGRFVRDSIAQRGKDGRHAAQNVMTAFFAVIKSGTNLNYVAPGLASLSIAASAAASISEIIGQPPIKEHTRVQPRAQKLRGDIEFKSVSFAYPKNPDKPIYDNITFKIRAGETIALVGPSGCGKSTAIQLLQRFYDLDDESGGTILIDGIPIKDYDITWLREQMALVSQEPRLFCKSLEENIRYGRLDASDEEIRQAATAANADKFIKNLPDQYETSAGLGGGLLSGGQKQRIAIARAILRDPAILILDEATSALDNTSEKIVQRALDTLLAENKRTTIIIAHRLSTIRNADRIFVLNNVDGGGSRIVESGSHDELMEIAGGLYKRLVSMQDIRPSSVNFANHLKSRQDSSNLSHSLAEEVEEESKKEDLCPLPLCDKPTRRLWFLQFNLHPFQFLGSALASAIIGGVQSASGVLLGWWMITFLTYDDSRTALENSSEMFKTAKLIAWVYLGVAFLFGAAQFSEAWLSDRISHLIVREMRERVFGSLLHQEIQFFDIPQYNVGFLQQILSSDCELAKTITGQNFSICVQAFFCLILGVTLSFIYSYKIAAPLLCVYLLIIPLVFAQTQTLKSSTQELQTKKVKKGCCGTSRMEQTSPNSSNIEDPSQTPQFLNNELINNLKTIIAFNLQKEFLKDFEKVVNGYYEIGRRNALISSLAVGITESAVILAVALGYGINYYWLEKGEFEYRPMIKALLVMFLACNGTTRTAAFTTDAHRAKNAASNIFTITNKISQADPRSKDGICSFKNSSEIPQININHVKFRYPLRPNQPILRDAHFEIPPGKTVALVGESGCGKSTIVQFLMRFYDLYPQAQKININGGGLNSSSGGSVELDGVDIQDYNLRFLRSNIGLVSQEPILFNTSIKENIRFGKFDGDEEAVVNAAKAANAHEFIMKLPKGYETSVGRQGSLLSGGQKQRIAIARALIRDPKILLLDEATSALDPESEMVVQAALENVLRTRGDADGAVVKANSKTTIMIAHRLSTIRNADLIVVFKANPGSGSVVAEMGTHDELMKLPHGIYSNLVAISS